MSSHPNLLDDADLFDEADSGGKADANQSIGIGRLSRIVASTRQWWTSRRRRLIEAAVGEDPLTGIGAKPWVFWSMVTVAFALMVYGFYLGNPFETYHNGSTL